MQGTIIGVVKGYTRSLDYSSFHVPFALPFNSPLSQYTLPNVCHGDSYTTQSAVAGLHGVLDHLWLGHRAGTGPN